MRCRAGKTGKLKLEQTGRTLISEIGERPVGSWAGLWRYGYTAGRNRGL
jgi:hypothetical protein